MRDASWLSQCACEGCIRGAVWLSQCVWIYGTDLELDLTVSEGEMYEKVGACGVLWMLLGSEAVWGKELSNV